MSAHPDAILKFREFLLEHADLSTVAEWGPKLANDANESLNAEGQMHVLTSLVTRAMAARSILHVAAAWAATFKGMPCEAVCLAALCTLVDDMPPQLEGGVYDKSKAAMQ